MTQGIKPYSLLLYITLENEQGYIEYDGMEHGITQDLRDRGVPSDQIVLAFLPEAPLAIAV